MSQNITLMGASYSDVPAVTLPKTGGGTARFTDTTPTTATDSDVASGKIYFKADGSQSTGTASGGGGTPNLQSKTVSYTPSETAQTETVSADSGYDGLDEVEVSVGAISSTYVGSGITQRTSSDLSASGATVTAPAGYYASQATKSVDAMTLPTSTSSSATSGYTSKATVSRSTSDQYINIPTGYNSSGAYYKVSAVANGTAGTPTASKGTVSNHSVSVTPSVTNTTGYITGSTKTGTAVTVSASELVSGSETKTANGTYDVTNLATLVVNVSGGGSSKNVQYYMGSKSVRTNGYTSTGITITVAKTGTYNVSWVGWRSSSQGTMGTNLYKNGSAGTNQQTFTNTYGQCITLTNQSYNQGDVLTLYATAGSNSRYMWAANLIIEEQ